MEPGVANSLTGSAHISSSVAQEQREIVARGEREILQTATKIRARRAEASRTRRIERNIEISHRNAAMPTGRRQFSIILADPPWDFDRTTWMNEGWISENHFPTLSHRA
jgi:hypothetical protein